MSYLKERSLCRMLSGISDLEESKKTRVFFAETFLINDANEIDSRLVEIFQMMKNDKWQEAASIAWEVWCEHEEILKTIRKFNDPLKHAYAIYIVGHLKAPLCLVAQTVAEESSSTQDENVFYDKAIEFVTDLQNKNS